MPILLFCQRKESQRAKKRISRINGNLPFQYEFLNRTSKFFCQLSGNKTDSLVECPCGDSLRYALPIGGNRDILPGIHLCKHIEYHFFRNMLSSVGNING